MTMAQPVQRGSNELTARGGSQLGCAGKLCNRSPRWVRESGVLDARGAEDAAEQCWLTAR